MQTRLEVSNIESLALMRNVTYCRSRKNNCLEDEKRDSRGRCSLIVSLPTKQAVDVALIQDGHAGMNIDKVLPQHLLKDGHAEHMEAALELEKPDILWGEGR